MAGKRATKSKSTKKASLKVNADKKAKAGHRNHLVGNVALPPRPHIKRIRKNLGVTQPVMGRLLGVSTRQVSAVESGQAKASEQFRRNLTEIDRLREVLAEVVNPEFIGEWLDTPNHAFDGLKPLEVIDRGEIDKIWQMVFYLQSGVSG